MKEYKVDGHVSSILPENGNWRLVWSDEFDGKALDLDKWDFRREIMGVKNESWCGMEGIELDGKSNCHFKLLEQDGFVRSAQLQTGYNFMDAVRDDAGTRYSDGLNWPIAPLKQNKYLHTYGYYECRCCLQKREGWWSAFWLQSPIIGASLDPAQSGIEFDIFESFHPGDCISHYIHWAGYGIDHQQVNSGEGLKNGAPDEWHTFGFEWSRDGYTFYTDGVEDGRLDGPLTECPEFILIGTEVMGYRDKDRMPTQAALDSAKAGDEFVVDYVRVFERD